MKTKTIAGVITAFIFIAGPVQAATFDRGNGLIYDDVLDITWLQNANLGAGSAFDDGSNNSDGRMSWSSAVAWADDLSFGGFDDWRLASMDVNGDGAIVSCAIEAVCRDNELSYMFYENLGGNLFDNLTGNQGLFENIGSRYWSATDFAPLPNFAWDSRFNSGEHGFNNKNNSLFAWAVRPGDVSASVPEPTTAALLGLGLLGFLGLVPRQRGRLGRAIAKPNIQDFEIVGVRSSPQPTGLVFLIQ